MFSSVHGFIHLSGKSPVSKAAGAAALIGIALILSGCTGASDGAASASPSGAGSGTIIGTGTTVGSSPGAPALPVGNVPSYTTAVLLFNGGGVSASDEQSLESILNSANINYKALTSAQINALTAADWATYGMLLVPGGLANTESSSLSASAITLIQNAVTNGMGYFGICAGAFLAGNYGSWGLSLVSNAFDYYVAESQGINEEAVQISYADGSKRDLIWYGGPQLDTFGSVVGKYPDGTTAIAQASSGKGFITLSGVHPEAPASWRTGMNDTDSLSADFAYVVTLVQSTLTHVPLASF